MLCGHSIPSMSISPNTVSLSGAKYYVRLNVIKGNCIKDARNIIRKDDSDTIRWERVVFWQSVNQIVKGQYAKLQDSPRQNWRKSSVNSLKLVITSSALLLAIVCLIARFLMSVWLMATPCFRVFVGLATSWIRLHIPSIWLARSVRSKLGPSRN